MEKSFKEYQDYIKKITDTFVAELTYNSAEPIEHIYTPHFKRVGGKIEFEYDVDDNFRISYRGVDEAPDQMGGDIKRPKDVVEAWRKIQMDIAIKWLNKNTITYDEWVKRNNS